LEVDVVRDNEARRYSVVMKDDVVARVDGVRLDDRMGGAVFNDFRDESDPKDGGGVLVSEVDVNGSAYAYGLKDGDVIVAANRRRIHDVGGLWRAFKADAVLRLRIYRSGRYGELSIR
jgi:S1-C subfamily serine protease